MAAVATEAYKSPRLTQDVDKGSGEIKYIVRGDDNADVALAAVVFASPTTYGELSLQTCEVDRVADGIYEGTATYGTKEKKKPGDSEFTFETGGGTQHITNDLNYINYVPAGQVAADFKNLINATEEGVGGLDINVPAFTFSVTLYVAAEDMTSEWLAQLRVATGKTNSDMVTINVDGVEQTFQQEELLFLGASGHKRGKDDWQITLRFAVQDNQVGLTIGDINGIDKKGWEYLEVQYQTKKDDTAHRLVQRPVQVIVHRVYNRVAFTGLLL